MDHLKPGVCPRFQFRGLRVAAAAVVLASACTPPGHGPAAPAPSAAIRWEPGTITAADSARVPVEFGELQLPQVRGGGTAHSPVTLRLVRFRSSSSTPGAPIIYLSGGSGSGIAAARGPRLPLFRRLSELGDVIAIDLRGAGRSEPRIACPEGEPLPVAVPIVHDTLTAILGRNARACAAALRSAGVAPEGFNVREIVADVEAVRAALGAPRVRLWGISTGSQLGLEYIRRHPRHVESAVLAGVQAPDQMLDMPAEHDRVIHALEAALAAAAPSDTAAKLVPLLRTVFAALDAAPQRVSVQDRRSGSAVTVGLGKTDAQFLVAGTLGDRRQMAMLPTAFGAAARGDYRMLAAFKLEGLRGGITSPYEALSDCQVPVSSGRRARVESQAGAALLGRATLDFPDACAGWGVAPLPASYGEPVRSSVPVLLISGTLDGRTTVENAEAALRGLANGSHLVVEGASHGDDLFLSTPEIAQVIQGYFQGERGPRTRSLRVSPPRANR
ncbi:MAG TPA: alpha/beta fold hydrolase [Longimicrobium sp.]|jgi:pimeloyl-ACP methyl ester carboxylesterase|uniref:alpha/beta hydrolase n=1 Tax=Longimicrobium sp. TaxID=2029185 RepID=UPI002EDA8D39